MSAATSEWCEADDHVSCPDDADTCDCTCHPDPFNCHHNCGCGHGWGSHRSGVTCIECDCSRYRCPIHSPLPTGGAA